MLSLLVIYTSRWHGHWSSDTSEGVQKIHFGAIPRIGGLTIFLALFLSCSLSFFAPQNIIEPNLSMLVLIISCSIPALFFGLFEDFSKNVKPIVRLAACCIAGVFGWFGGFQIGALGIANLDLILAYAPISFLVTILSVAALANAMNMLDGLNGLSSGTALIVLGVFAAICFYHDADGLGMICLIIFSAILGFFIFNWPFGRIFLGDGGAYMLGAIMAFIAMEMAATIDEVTQVTTLIILAYPAWEITNSVTRRILSKAALTAPDHDHLHARLYKLLRDNHKRPKRLANPIASMLLLAITAGLAIISALSLISFEFSAFTKFLIVFAEFFVYSLIFNGLKPKS